MQSWKQCVLPFITSMASLQLLHLGIWWTMLQQEIMRWSHDLRLAIVVASRAHCFHDCINLAPREILKTLLFPLMTKRCAGNVAVIAYIHRCYIYHYYYYLFIIIIYLLLYIIILYIMLFIFVKDININNQLSLHGVSLVLPNLLFYM